MSKIVKGQESQYRDEEYVLLSDIEIPQIIDELAAHVNMHHEENYRQLDEAQTILDSARQRSEQIVRQAQEEAQILVAKASEDAYEMAKRISVEHAQQLVLIEDEARNKGYEQGYIKKLSDVQNTLDVLQYEMEETANTLKQSNEERMQRWEKELARLSLLVAEKVLHKQVEENSLVLMPLVRQALSTLKTSRRLHIALSPKAQEIKSMLEQEFLDIATYKDKDVNVEEQDQDISVVTITCDMGMYDISIDSQLENLSKLMRDL